MNSDWMNAAACATGDTDWTGDKPPRPTIMARLAQVCDGCPVAAQCAGHALDQQVQGGMYAGVWVPLHGITHIGKGWLEARDQLQLRRNEVA